MALDTQPDTDADRTAIRVAGPRIHWIDQLRVVAIAGVFVFHTFRPFDATDWHVKNAATDQLLGGVQIFLSSFGLAVLFLLAGAGARFALRRRTPREFLRERTARLLVPFLAGTLLLSPLQWAIERGHRTAGTDALQSVVDWWRALPAAIASHGISPTVFGIGYHLWFLGFLFACSLVALPLFAALGGPRGSAAVDGLARRVAASPGSTLVFALPIALLLLAGAALGVEEHGWHEFGQYLAYFVIGYLFVADERCLPAVRRDGPLAVAVLLLSGGALVALDFVGWLLQPAHEVDVRGLTMGLLFAVQGWAATLIVLNLGMRLARLQRPVGRRLAEAVLPVYVLHQPVILAVAAVVVAWPAEILPKWLAILVSSAVITGALVGLALRIPLARSLLGARLAASPPGATLARPTLAGSHG
jgi:peptidoglycan/LPS O-acetylase OafA/YrhL